MFHKGQKKGKGELKLNNGNTYIGEFKNDKYNGKGKIKDFNGNLIQEGEFKEGIFVKFRIVSNYKSEKSIKDNISVISNNYKNLNANPLHDNEEIKLNAIQQNDSIDEDEENIMEEEDKKNDVNVEKEIEKEQEKEIKE